MNTKSQLISGKISLWRSPKIANRSWPNTTPQSTPNSRNFPLTLKGEFNIDLAEYDPKNPPSSRKVTRRYTREIPIRIWPNIISQSPISLKNSRWCSTKIANHIWPNMTLQRPPSSWEFSHRRSQEILNQFGRIPLKVHWYTREIPIWIWPNINSQSPPSSWEISCWHSPDIQILIWLNMIPYSWPSSRKIVRWRWRRLPNGLAGYDISKSAKLLRNFLYVNTFTGDYKSDLAEYGPSISTTLFRTFTVWSLPSVKFNQFRKSYHPLLRTAKPTDRR